MKMTAAEGEILGVLWRAAGPMTADQVIAMVNSEHEWSRNTIRTFLARLVKSNMVGVRRATGRYLYQATLGWGEYAHREIRSLLERFFAGSVVSLIAHLAARRDLSEQDLAQLGALIEAERVKLRRDDHEARPLSRPMA